MINDICDYDWSATFVTAAGVTCQITARSLEVNNNRINLAIAPGNCPTTVTVERPGQVTGVAYRVDNRTNGAGRVVWDAETDATSYDFVVTLSLEDVDDGFQSEIERSLTGRRCCVATVAPGPGLRIRAIEMSVRAVNSAGAGRWSRSVIAGVTYPTARPGAVTGLRYDRSSGRIVWQPVSGATAYDVQWRQPGEGAVARAVLCSSSDETRVGSRCALLITRVRHKELDFRVRAKNNAGTNFGPWTGWSSDPAETSEPVQPPGLVSGLAFSNGRISWLPTFGATAYSIEWRNAGENITRQTVHCSSSRSCSLSISRAEDRELQFRARAVNDGGSGPWSSWQTSRPEVNTPPQAVTITTASTAGTYTVSWQTQGRCDPGGGTSGASGSTSRRVRDDDTPPDGEGDPVEFTVVINDICDYDWSATFVTAAGVTCQITARSLEVNNNRINLAIAPGNCPTTVTVERPGQVTGVAYRVDNRTNGAGRVVWDAETDATSYDFVVTLSLEDVDDGFQSEIERSLTGRRCCVATVAPGPGLRIRAIEMSVRAVNSAGAGRWSRSVIAGVTYPTARPGAVTGLRYDRSSGRIVWQPVSGATAYDVQWRQPGEGAVARAVLCSSSDETRVGSRCALLITRVRHKELDFRVRAKNNAGTNFGPWTGWSSDPAETSEPVQPPGLVSGLAFSNGRISWLPTFGATAYSIEWRNAGENITRQTVHCSSSRSCSLSISRAEDRELQFRARAVNDGGSGPWSSWQTSRPEVNTPPPVTGMDYRAGHIVWNAIPDVNSYDVEWRHAGETTVARTVHCSSSCSLRIDRVRHKELQFRVRGINAEGRGAWPAAWQRRQPEVMTPGAMVGLQYQSGRAVWRAASNASTYEIQMDGRGGARTLTGLACCRSAVADNVTRFRMRALNENLAGPWSAWIAAPSENRPSQVTGIKYINVQASWKRTPTADSYDVAWSYNSQAHTLVRSVHCCFYRIPLGIATSIQVNIRAVNRGGAGPWSGWKTIWTSDIKPPDKVTGLRHVSHQGLAKWDPVPNVTRYRVSWRSPGKSSDSPVNCTSNCSKTIDQHRTLPIEFRVRAVNGGGRGPWSDWYRIRPSSEIPSKSPTITSLNKHSNWLPRDAEDVTVYWQRVSWATKYTVKWRYLDFTGDISKTVKGKGVEAVDDVRTWIENEDNYRIRGSDHAKLGDVDEYRVKNVASNSEDRNYALQFQVVALNRTGESRESSWVYLASSEIRDRLSYEASYNKCKAYDLANDVWTVVSIIGALYTGGTASAILAAVTTSLTQYRDHSDNDD